MSALSVVLHDDLNAALREEVARIEPHDVANAFVAALQPRRFEHWSALASYALARTLPLHAFAPMTDRRPCGVCGAYARLEAFESDDFKKLRVNGTVRTDSLRYALYDLQMFSRDPVSEARDADRAFFQRAIARISHLPPDARTFAAEKALGIVFPSRVERKLFLGVLGVCGILAAPSRPGFWPAFVPFEHRAHLDPSPYSYPVTWWRGSVGIRRDALEAFALDRFLS